MNKFGSYVKPEHSNGLPQLACSPGFCRFITDFIPRLETDTRKKQESNKTKKLENNWE
jgi:hypothetical protein